MNIGRLFVILIVVAALLTGGAIYYLQVYAFYEEIAPRGASDVVLTPLGAEEPEPIAHDDFRAIDADSSPIRYRACFTTEMGTPDLAAYEPYPDADPLVAPSWFDCFDAAEVGAALEDGSARSYLSVAGVHYGIDRVIAVFDDGRGVAWNQINACGEVVFDGNPAPEGCPPAPEGYDPAFKP